MRRAVGAVILIAGCILTGCILMAGCGAPAPKTPEPIVVMPMGRPSAATVEAVRSSLAGFYRVPVRVAPRIDLPREAYRRGRNRYSADALLDWIRRRGPVRTIGVTERDIAKKEYLGRKDWGVMGLAHQPGSAAMVSSFRAKGRIGLVAVHEIGHSYGLDHCPRPDCLMRHGENRGALLDAGLRFCASCRGRVPG